MDCAGPTCGSFPRPYRAAPFRDPHPCRCRGAVQRHKNGRSLAGYIGMNAGVRVLLVEDNVVDAELLVREMQRGQLSVDALRVDTKETLEDALQAFRPDIVLSD